jgi:DNA-binding transcriptional LysR family regulator
VRRPPLGFGRHRTGAIRDLERQLGVQLLTRTTRQVTLTPAGQTLLADARAVLDAAAAAARRARRAGHPEPKLRVALKADFDAGLLPPILDAYHALAVELVLGGPGDQVPDLRDGRADVALVLTPFEGRGLDSEVLVTEPWLVALPATDPLAARTTIRLPDLAGRRLPNGSRADSGNNTPPPPGSALIKDLSQLFTWSRSENSSGSSRPGWPGGSHGRTSPTGRCQSCRQPGWRWPGSPNPGPRPSRPSSARPTI